MARIDPSAPAPASSILDRLLAEGDATEAVLGPLGASASDSERPRGLARPTWQEGVRSVKAAVVRDLEWLLNARAPYDPQEAETIGERTVMDFGLPDLTLLDLRDEEDRARLERQIADAIECFEPRLRDVFVRFRGSEEPQGQTRFHVEGTLQVEPEAVEFPFDTTVKWQNRRIVVREERV